MDVHSESDDRELCSGHGHVYWMALEIVMVADNIDVMSASAECGDHWRLQQVKGGNLIVFDSFNDQAFCEDVITTDVNLTTKGPLGTPRKANRGTLNVNIRNANL